jgi:peptide/nickel transport system substrate-binding protein
MITHPPGDCCGGRFTLDNPNSDFQPSVYDAPSTGRGGIRIVRSLKIALVAALAITGCAPSPDPVTALRLAYQHEMVTMDPHAHADSVTGLVLSAVYESLVRFEPGMPVRASLADRWTTPDASTWRLHIRDGVRFHDGRRLQPADVITSIERARTSRVLGHQLDEIKGMTLVAGDDRTIEITTTQPAPLLLTRLETIAIVPDDFDPRNPVGTGPYTWMDGSIQGPVVLQRWGGYWGRSPDFELVNIQFVSLQEELVKLVGSSLLDVVASVTPSYVREHPPTAPWRVVAMPGATTTYLGLNVTRKPLDDLRVREAIDDAIDRERLVKELFPPGGATPPASLVPSEVFGFSPEYSRHGPALERARRLLEEVGLAPGTSLRLDVTERNGDVTAPLVAALAEVGLAVEPEVWPYETFYRRIEDAENQLFVFSWNFRVADASPFLDAIVHSRDPVLGLGSFNGAAVRDPHLDQLMEEAAHETRSEARLELLQQALTEVGLSHTYLPLFQPAILALLRESFEVVGQQIRPQDLRMAD